MHLHTTRGLRMSTPRIVALSVISCGLGAWGLYLMSDTLAPDASQPRYAGPLPMAEWCSSRSTDVDSITAEAEARRALGEPAFSSSPFALYGVTRVENGFVISLGPRVDPRTIALGGGGLVWVDRARGCAKVLQWYE